MTTKDAVPKSFDLNQNNTV